MTVSGFTFLRNAAMLGFPFEQSIRSLLPLVDEFVVALGPCEDDTEARLRALGDPRIRIVPTHWNEHVRNDTRVKGFIYGQQKSIALFNCTGDWAFYLEGDELVHEDDLPRIRAAMERHLANRRVEALYFDYLHFYGNANTVGQGPSWYRREVRVVRNNLPLWAPKGLFFSVLVNYKRSRYPRAARADATIYHYGWVRPEAQMNEKWRRVHRHWRDACRTYTYAEFDPAALAPFRGTHPRAIREWLPPAEGLFQTDPAHRLTPRERKNRAAAWIERRTGLDLARKHFTPLD
jgi:glycosyltransferase involved in cell wall biosynthesis